MTDSSGAGSPPGTTGGGEDGGDKELDSRTRAVEKALGPLITKVWEAPDTQLKKIEKRSSFSAY